VAVADNEVHYRVTWAIDEWCATPEEAAQRALDTQRDPLSIATVFHVKEWPDGPEVKLDLGGDDGT